MNYLREAFQSIAGRRRFAIVLLSLLGLNLAGCAAPATVEGMSVSPGDAIVTPASFPLKEKLAIGEVSGGEDTNPLWTSEVGNEEFRGALETSLRNGALAAPSAGNALYRLNAHLVNIQQPIMGFDITITSTGRYELISNSGGDRVWEETISATHTGTVNDAFVFDIRLRLANEGTIKENIKKLIQRLHQFPN